MESPVTLNKKDVSVVLCGQAGQGIQTVERILVRLLKLSGFTCSQPRNTCPVSGEGTIQPKSACLQKEFLPSWTGWIS